MKIGIVGTGRIAGRFVAEAEVVSKIEIAAIYNPHIESAQLFVKEQKNRGFLKETKICADLIEFLQIVEAVYIASPHQTHFDYIKKALQYKKHILCEKPMVLKETQAKEVFDIAKENGCVLFEGIKTAYCTGFQKLIETAKRGAVGKIKSIETCFTKLENPNNRELSDIQYGGSFIELGSYVMLPILRLFGVCYQDVRFDIIRGDSTLDIFTAATFIYDNKIAYARCGLGVKSEGSLIIGGTEGYIKAVPPWWKTSKFEVHYEDPNLVDVYEEAFEGEGLRYEIDEFISAVDSGNTDNIKLPESESIAMSRLMEMFCQCRN